MVKAMHFESINNNPTLSRSKIWLELEKYWNTGSPSGFGIRLKDPYDPKSRPGRFLLPVYAMSWDKVTRIGSYPQCFPVPRQLDKEYIPIHPLCVTANFRKKKPAFFLECTASSSGRTVAILKDTKLCCFIKLHFPLVLGRFTRGIPLYSWLASIAISTDLFYAGRSIPSNTAFLLETGGVYVEGDNYNFGSIFRSATPFPEKSFNRIMPAFSLVMSGTNQKQSITLLRTIFGKKIDQDQFIKFAITPIIDTFVWMTMKRGLIPECNAQNVLFGFDQQPITGPWCLILRDFSDFFIDLEIRKANHLNDNFTRYKVIGGWAPEEDLFQRRSFAFDFKLSEYLIRPLIKTASATYNWKESNLQEKIRLQIRNRIPIKKYFDSENAWYRYPKSKRVSRLKYERIEGIPPFR